MPHDGTVAPSYASAAIALRSIEFEIAQRTAGLSSGAWPPWIISARGQGSSHAYGALPVHALTFGLRCATFRNVPSDRMPIFGVSRSFELSASATFVSGPLYKNCTV